MQILIRLTIYKEGKLITATSFRDNQLAETRDRYAYAKELYNEPSSLHRVRCQPDERKSLQSTMIVREFFG